MNQAGVGTSIGALRFFECEGSYIAIDRSASVLLKELSLADADISAVADLVDMVLLDEVDSLLCCLDDWAGHIFDWTPRSVAEDDSENTSPFPGKILPLHELRACPGFTTRMSLPKSQSPALLLALNMATLDALPPFPDTWGSLVDFYQYLKPMKLQLQQMSLLDEEYRKLETGAMVLLPWSFTAQWQAKLVATDACSWNLDAPGNVVVDTEQSRLHISPPVVTDAKEQAYSSDAPILTVELEGLVNINELYTESHWQLQQNMVIALPQMIGGARVVIRVDSLNEVTDKRQSDKSSDPLVWFGTLMKVGQGYGVVLEG